MNQKLQPSPSTLSPWWLAAAMAVMMLLFCITTLFNTKGEPREALVAVSMLESGDWVLPSSFGGEEMPYKPPFLAWCIALASLIFGGGHVNEFTSRLPSLIAAMLMTVATARFFIRYGGRGRLAGWMTAWVTITSFEVFRAATACRVDMVLTAFMVGALYSLYGWFDRRSHKGMDYLPWTAIILMSGAFLTKGPIGVFLPCLAIGIYRLINGDRLYTLFLRLLAAGLGSLIVPAIWYVCAYINGGERFVELVLEENVGRLTGSMSYESHENPAYYNVITLIAGMVPYTLLALMALIAVKWEGWFRRLKARFSSRANLTSISTFALTAALTIFIFYCIPKSKRSVYLLPMYPFVAWGVVVMMQWLADSRYGRSVIRWFTYIISSLAILIPLAWCALKLGAGDGIRETASFNDFQPVWMSIISGLLGLLSVFIGVGVIRKVSKKSFVTERIGLQGLLPQALALFAVYTMLDTAILPPILSSKTDRVVAEQLQRLQPEGEIWSWVSTPLLRFYTTNFYTGDRLRQVPAENPSLLPPSGHLMIIGDKDLQQIESLTGAKFTELWRSDKRSCDTKQHIVIVRVESKPAPDSI